MLTKRKKIGSIGSASKYYHIVLRPKGGFVSFKTQGIGKLGRTWKISGKKRTGVWSTQKLLITKKDAVVENGVLKGTNRKTIKILKTLGASPRQKRGNVFSAKPRNHTTSRKLKSRRH